MEKLINEFSVGLFFWQTVLFIALLFLLRKYAWKPTLNAINRREKSIEEALNEAEKTRREMKELQSKNEAMLQEARAERDQLLKEARDMKNEILSDAKTKAKEEADKIFTASREEIRNEKLKALAELKHQIADFSFQIAEKVLNEKLSGADKQNDAVKKALEEINFN